MVVTYGSLSGVALAAVQLVRHDSLARAVAEGIVVGALIAVALALLGPGRTPVASTVPVQDVASVVEAVRRGETVADLRLADPVLRHSRDVQARLQRERFYCWVPPILALATLLFAVLASAFGTGAGSIIAWTACACWIVLTIWIPLRRSSAMENAQTAEDGALSLLAADFAGRADC